MSLSDFYSPRKRIKEVRKCRQRETLIYIAFALVENHKTYKSALLVKSNFLYNLVFTKFFAPINRETRDLPWICVKKIRVVSK